eukprot:3849080-Prymnesium_polylepis.2
MCTSRGDRVGRVAGGARPDLRRSRDIQSGARNDHSDVRGLSDMLNGFAVLQLNHVPWPVVCPCGCASATACGVLNPFRAVVEYTRLGSHASVRKPPTAVRKHPM